VRTIGIVLLGGSGARFSRSLSPERPKQLLTLGSKLLFMHAVESFLESSIFEKILLVVNKAGVAKYKKALAGLPKKRRRRISIMIGGPSRNQSLLRGLKSARIKKQDIVIIHDGARPFVNPKEIRKLKSILKKKRVASFSRPVTDTLYDKQSASYLDRSRFLTIQTPQGFRGRGIAKKLVRLYENPKKNYPDDTSALSSLGYEITFIESSPLNLKLTYKNELEAFGMLAKVHR